jgi:3-hydroxyacyl-CoA dehydrogenase
MAYASKRVPEIADSIVDIDNAVKWGFAWEMGPFETWDALGVEETANRLEGEGVSVAPWVTEMLETGHESFYTYHGMERMAYSPLAKQYVPVERSEKIMTIGELKRCHATIAENEAASLIDMGDGVMLLEFHSKMNALDDDIFKIANVAVDRLYGDAIGLVIGNEGDNFSAGANLLKVAILAQSGQWNEIGMMLKGGQDTMMALRKAPKPVVAAPFNLALGGGVEICLAADRIVAAAESYMGLVEVGVGIIPSWGGCKEMVRRHVSPHMHEADADPEPYLQRVFETIGFAKVSSSAQNAVELGYLSEQDRVVMNLDHLLWEAKHEVLTLSDGAYHAPDTTNSVYAAGRNMLAALRVRIHAYKSGGYISEYDAEIADRLAFVLCGGELSEPAWMNEQYFLDLEREALLTLAGQPKTVERIVFTLSNGKPLRN